MSHGLAVAGVAGACLVCWVHGYVAGRYQRWLGPKLKTSDDGNTEDT